MNLLTMDETFHINLEGYQTETHWINIVKTRLWSYQLMSLNWLIRSRLPGSTNIQNGFGLIIINTLALSIEGLIMDLISEHLFDNALEKNENIRNINRKHNVAQVNKK